MVTQHCHGFVTCKCFFVIIWTLNTRCVCVSVCILMNWTHTSVFAPQTIELKTVTISCACHRVKIWPRFSRLAPSNGIFSTRHVGLRWARSNGIHLCRLLVDWNFQVYPGHNILMTWIGVRDLLLDILANAAARLFCGGIVLYLYCAIPVALVLEPTVFSA